MSSIDPSDAYIHALVEIHRGLKHKGPGDPTLSLSLLPTLTAIPPQPRIGDLGCGSGASALLLAQHYQSPVVAIDLSSVFIHELRANANRAGLEHLITPIQGDMAQLNWPEGSFDLLWSEGAAYNLGFETALTLWRPWLSENGIIVVSELSWLRDNPPETALNFWQQAYPEMGSEADNIARAQRSGFNLVATRRLSSQAWWQSYYGPLRQRIQQLETTPILAQVVDEIEQEINLFEQFNEWYGYTFYVLQSTPR